MKRFGAIILFGLLLAAILPAANTLDMWLVDTEGGKALLLVAPSGETMLVDTGFPGLNGNSRDANRIIEAAKAAGIKKIDTLVTTHYDLDHVTDVPEFAAKIPIGLFVDHGAPAVNDEGTADWVKAYSAVWAKAKHRVVKPGDTIAFGGVNVLVVTAAGEALKTPIKGAGAPNPACAGVARMAWTGTDQHFTYGPYKILDLANQDASENGHALGLLFTYGQFKMLDLADLTWNRELELMCPNNPIGTVDLFMASHHGHDISNSPALVNALHARVVMMSNGPQKMGMPNALKLIKAAPGFQALYATHWSENAPVDNPPDAFIANLKTSPDGKWLKASVSQDGTIVVTNGRTGESKTYKR